MSKEERFNTLFGKHYPKVFRLCKGYFNGNDETASDAAQEVFIKIWEHLDAFRGEANIGTWIYRIAVNTCLLQLRKPSVRNEIRTAVFPPIAAESAGGEEEEKLRKMYACIQRLRSTDKVIILMVLDGADYQQIAEVTGLTEETLRVRVHRIKKNLTDCVQNGNL